jgi:hypothetical protein
VKSNIVHIYFHIKPPNNFHTHFPPKADISRLRTSSSSPLEIAFAVAGNRSKWEPQELAELAEDMLRIAPFLQVARKFQQSDAGHRRLLPDAKKVFDEARFVKNLISKLKIIKY